jgi:hypothetical protein
MDNTASTALSTGKAGTLCAGGFETGSGTYWEVRRITATSYVVYRTSVAVTEVGRYTNPTDAYAEYHRHVPPRAPDLEESMGR